MSIEIKAKNIELTITTTLRGDALPQGFAKRAELWLPELADFALGIAKDCEAFVSLHLMVAGDQKVKSLNRDHRGFDKTTDVLSFPLFDDLRSGEEQIWGPLELGDIVVSWPVVLKQAKEFKITPEQELIHLFIHGFLHLLGFDHEISSKEEELMEKYEKQLVDIVYNYLAK